MPAIDAASGARAPPGPRPAYPIAADWTPNEIDRAYAETAGLSSEAIGAETEKFRDHYLGRGEPRADWSAQWRTWIRLSIEKGRRDEGTTTQRGDSEAERLADAFEDLAKNGRGSAG
ncbi:hypothetical protein [Bauldia sp.]|uniref:hypothetical protein n=1 Tax=Bauldia sp. TaxID=2575872 RepID=UPI003BABD232